MTKDSSRPLWLPPISLLVMALAIWLLSFPPKALSDYPLIPFAVTGQAALLFIFIRAFCYWPPLVQWVSTMPVPHRVIFAVIIAAMIYGHFSLNPRTSYPFISWFIFPAVREEDPVTCREFIATTESGKKVRLLVEQLFPSIIQIYPLDDPEHYSPERLEYLSYAMTRAYNRRHTSDPVRGVDLVLMSVQLHPPAGESRAQPSCQLLKRYEISLGQ